VPALHREQLEAGEERRVERIVVGAGDARIATEIGVEGHVTAEDLHAQERENEEEEEKQQCQVDEGIHGFDEDIHDDLHRLEGPQQLAYSYDAEDAEDSHTPETLMSTLER
jgi:hypothetical protein